MEGKTEIPPSTISFIRTICVATLFVIILLIIIQICSTIPYGKVSGTITDVRTQIGYGFEDHSGMRKNRVISCEYNVDETEYTVEFASILGCFLSSGKTISILYDRSSPSNIFDCSSFETKLIVAAFLLLLIIVLTLIQRKSSAKSDPNPTAD